MIVKFSIRPMRQPSGELDATGETATAERAVDPRGSDRRPRSMSAAIEGSWDQVMSVIRGCHQAHVAGHPRVVTTIVVVDDNANGDGNGWPQLLRDMAQPEGTRQEQAATRVRRIPVESPQ